MTLLVRVKDEVSRTLVGPPRKALAADERRETQIKEDVPQARMERTRDRGFTRRSEEKPESLACSINDRLPAESVGNVPSVQRGPFHVKETRFHRIAFSGKVTQNQRR
jgi:hypothetical protein